VQETNNAPLVRVEAPLDLADPTAIVLDGHKLTATRHHLTGEQVGRLSTAELDNDARRTLFDEAAEKGEGIREERIRVVRALGSSASPGGCIGTLDE
jgi:hypothetical protein